MRRCVQLSAMVMHRRCLTFVPLQFVEVRFLQEFNIKVTMADFNIARARSRTSPVRTRSQATPNGSHQETAQS